MRRGSRVRIVGHSLGGMLARGLAVRRPDLVSGIVTMGSPMLAPGAHHLRPHRGRRRAGPAQPGRRAGADVGGVRGRRLRPAELRESPAAAARRRRLHRDLLASATASSTGGPASTRWRRAVEVTASHLGMAVDPRVRDHVVAALRGGRGRVGSGRSKSTAA